MRRKQGLSLVEIILSIAVLSIFSVFILEMFLTSKAINLEARDLDFSVFNSENVIHFIRASNDLEDLKKNSFFENATWESEPLIALHWDENWQSKSGTDDFKYCLRVYSDSNLKGSILVKVVRISKEEELLIYEVEAENSNP